MSRRTRVWLKFNGERISVAECARRIGISQMALWGRLRRGVSLAELFAPGYGPRKPTRAPETPAVQRRSRTFAGTWQRSIRTTSHE